MTSRLPVVAVLRAVAVRPHLWPIALRQSAVLAAPQWWRRHPFLPVPTPDYVAFRLQTMYGGSAPADASDVLRWLAWAKRERREISGRCGCGRIGADAVRWPGRRARR